jgi:hypothetical protein
LGWRVLGAAPPSLRRLAGALLALFAGPAGPLAGGWPAGRAADVAGRDAGVAGDDVGVALARLLDRF